jgi:hypothetical protein
MLSIVGIVIVLGTAVIVPRILVPGGVKADQLGWMSGQSLAPHSASRSAWVFSAGFSMGIGVTRRSTRWRSSLRSWHWSLPDTSRDCIACVSLSGQID